MKISAREILMNVSGAGLMGVLTIAEGQTVKVPRAFPVLY